MIDLLTADEQGLYEGFKEFVELHVKPYAAKWEREEVVSDEIVALSAQRGYLGAMMPTKFGGNNWTTVEYGIFTEAVARYSTSLAGLYNVHTMVLQTILKWGDDFQRQKYLPGLCRGEKIAALALTEPGAGSDLNGLTTQFTLEEGSDTVVIKGCKRWITYGGLADVLLVFGVTDEEKPKPMAMIVEKDTPGLTITPISGMLGFKASYLAIVTFDQCRVPKANILGKPGTAFSVLAPYALDYGRISVYFTALGMMRGSLEHCCTHVSTRKTFGEKLIKQSTMKELITKMGADYDGASHLCMSASRAKDNQDPLFAQKVMTAKYFTVRAANRHAHSAVQILGAMGCNESHPVTRYYRDTKVLEIIEGSNQIHEMVLVNTYVSQHKQKHLTRDYLMEEMVN